MEVKKCEQKRNLKMFLSLLFAVIFLASIVPIACADPGWNYRRAINITNSGSALTYYQVLVTLNTSNFNYSKANADGSDLRFTNYENSTKYNYWIETWNTAGESRIWVNVSSVPTGDSKMYMWYNNSAASGESNGDVTFEFFDDFEYSDNIINHNWTFVQGSSAQTSTEKSKHDSRSLKLNDSSGATDIRKEYSLPSTFVLEIDTYDDLDTSKNDWIGVTGSTSAPDIGVYTGVDTTHFHYYASGSWTASSILRTTGWHKYSFYYSGSGNYVLKVDDIQIWSGPENTATKPFIRNGGGSFLSAVYWDGLRVRKYADPEPTTSVSATEEDVTGPVDPVSELPTIILFSIGLLMLAGYVVIRRKNR